ncbi:MAG: Na+/H+ antiporter subunit E [candidate division KSB1 bacterium]|nr:Na+/H+ antiporter subunit E [candidate division KSB1 bacterium]
MSIKFKSRIFVFILSLLVWLALTDIKNVQELIAGSIVALLVSLTAGHWLITTSKQKHVLHRSLYALIYFLKFLREMVKANLHVAYIVVHPRLPIKPGIVKIKTRLTKEAAITVLTNSITLTPGTLTIDVDEKKSIYVHWIDIKSKEVNECTELIGNRFEPLLTEVFE